MREKRKQKSLKEKTQCLTYQSKLIMELTKENVIICLLLFLLEVILGI